jgi:hypothetical protein
MTGASSEHGVRSPPCAGTILALCDRVLGEIGRRSHLFAWLRAPGAGPGEWLAVDGYYPANRLVVVCRVPDDPLSEVYAELVPAHGLRLLQLTPSELGADAEATELPDPAAAETMLRALIAELELPARRVPTYELDDEAPTRDTAISRVAASLAQATLPDVFESQPSAARTAATERGARYIAARSAEAPPRSGAPAPRQVARLTPFVSRRPPTGPRGRTLESQQRLLAHARGRARRRSGSPPEVAAVGVIVGVALAVVIGVELYAGVGGFALSGGHVLLAFGLAFDACSRVLGTVAARRAGGPGWAWACVLVGCPAVAAFAMFGRDGPVAVDPAPLAGLIAVLAGLLIAVAVVGNALMSG